MHFRAHTFSVRSSAASNKCAPLCNTVSLKNEPGWRYTQIALHMKNDTHAMSLQQSPWP